jgi:hypothetical protein
MSVAPHASVARAGAAELHGVLTARLCRLCCTSHLTGMAAASCSRRRLLQEGRGSGNGRGNGQPGRKHTNKGDKRSLDAWAAPAKGLRGRARRNIPPPAAGPGSALFARLQSGGDAKATTATLAQAWSTNADAAATAVASAAASGGGAAVAETLAQASATLPNVAPSECGRTPGWWWLLADSHWCQYWHRWLTCCCTMPTYTPCCCCCPPWLHTLTHTHTHTHTALLAKSADLAVNNGQTDAFASAMAGAFAASMRASAVPSFTRTVASAVSQGGDAARLATGQAIATAVASGGDARAAVVQATAVAMCEGGSTAEAWASAFAVALSENEQVRGRSCLAVATMLSRA